MSLNPELNPGKLPSLVFQALLKLEAVTEPWVPLHKVIKNLVAEWIHFTLFGIILPTIELKVYTFGGL